MKTHELEKIGPCKKLLFSLITIFIVWLFLDTAAYILLKRGGSFRIFHGFVVPSNGRLEAYYKSFHPWRGWDLTKIDQGAMGNRKSREYEKKGEYKIKVFGNSFAYGQDVKDSETFEYVIEEKTDWECLNYGVSATGTDQALLKYKDNKIKTKYTILCILDENIRRCVSISWGFYIRGGLAPKPRFAVSDDNSVFLIPNPVKDYNDLQKFKDVEFIDSLRKYDYWANYWEEVNAPMELKWPATRFIFMHFDFFVNKSIISVRNNLAPTYETEIQKLDWYHLYSDGSEGIQIMRYIVDDFITTAKQREEIPIIIIFPIHLTVDILSKYGKKPYQSLVIYLKEIECNFIDFGDIFVREEYRSYYLGRWEHFSSRGHERVADELISYIKQLERLRDGSR